MTFDVIIPVYNETLKSVPSLTGLSVFTDVTVIICDNSTDTHVKEINAAQSKGFASLNYVDMGGNTGLARAYNAGVRTGFSDVICIFDDDTYVPADYFPAVARAIEQSGSGVYVPLIKSGDALLSPLKASGPAIHRVKDPSAIRANDIYAFNSGMAITRDVLSRVSWDETLFIDSVDHAFCQDLHRADIPIMLLDDVELEQDYSRETDNLASALHRDVTFRRDVRRFYSRRGGVVSKVYCEAYLFYRLVRNTVHYHTTAFLTLRETVNERAEKKSVGVHGDLPRGDVYR